MTPERRPVFHDPSGRRMRWTLRVVVAIGAAFLALAIVFLVSLVAVPVLPRTLGISEPALTIAGGIVLFLVGPSAVAASFEISGA